MKSKTEFLTSVDPGLNATAWAVWFRGKLIRVGMVHSKQSRSLLWRCRQIAHTMRYAIPVNSRVVIEYPAFMPGTAGGMMVAARGDLVKLTILVGYLSSAFHWQGVQLIPVHKWKGQLPKRIVEQRITAVLRSPLVKTLKKDEWDAVGIGLYCLWGKEWFN